MSYSINNRGMSLPGIMVAVAILGILAMATAQLFMNMVKSQNYNRSQSETTNFHDEVRAHLSNKQACLNSFSGLTLTSGTTFTPTRIRNGETPPTPPTTKYNLTDIYAVGTLKINTMSMSYLDDPSEPSSLTKLFVGVPSSPAA